MKKIIELAQANNIEYIEFTRPLYDEKNSLADGLSFIKENEDFTSHFFSHSAAATLFKHNPEIKQEFERVLSALETHPQTKWASWVLNTKTGMLRTYGTENLPQNAAYTFNRLEELGAASAKLQYQGYGDSGNIFDITLYDSEGNVIEPEPRAKGAPKIDRMEVFFNSFLKQEHGDWEVSEGSSGVVMLDVANLADYYSDLENPTPTLYNKHASHNINITDTHEIEGYIQKYYEYQAYRDGDLEAFVHALNAQDTDLPSPSSSPSF